MIHELKIQKQWADAKLAGEKPFEIRINDRGFQKGDIVHYTVIDPKTGERYVDPGDKFLVIGDDYPGSPTYKHHPLEQCEFLITYVIEGKDGLERGYCVYADQPVLKRPVSADLGSGATPSNGTAEPLAPPSPLAES